MQSTKKFGKDIKRATRKHYSFQKLVEIVADGQRGHDGLVGNDVQCTPVASHSWLMLPALRGGINGLTSGEFAVDRDQPMPHAIGINLSTVRARDAVRNEVSILSDLLPEGIRKAGTSV